MEERTGVSLSLSLVVSLCQIPKMLSLYVTEDSPVRSVINTDASFASPRNRLPNLTVLRRYPEFLEKSVPDADAFRPADF